MKKNTRILLIMLLLVLIGVSIRRFFPWDTSEQSGITQIPIAQQIQPWEPKQEMVIPEKAIASVQPSDGAELIPVEWATTFTLGQGSAVQWTMRSIDAEPHQWSVAIRQWIIQVVDGNIVAGWLILDMNTITSIDPLATWFVNDLKSFEFFAVNDFPTSSFILQEVGGGQIVGVLTIKWVSQQITFPGIVIVEDDSIVVTAEFAIDRKYRGINGWGADLSDFIELAFTVRYVP
jgi:hypothetical protein